MNYLFILFLKKKKIQINEGKEKEKEETLKIVDCPICSNKVEMEKINEHIDSGCQKMIVPNVQNSNPSTAHHTSFFSPSSDTLQKNAYFQAQKPIEYFLSFFFF